MPTYISLVRWTQKGIENIKESPSRLDAAKKTFQAKSRSYANWQEKRHT